MPAPHRGDANRPISIQGNAKKPDQGNAKNPDQGKAKNPDQGKAKKPDQGKAKNPDQGKANTIKAQTNKRRAGNPNLNY